MTHDPGAGLAEALSSIEDLIAEGRALEVTIVDYAKRVHQITVAVEARAGRVSRYDDLWDVVDDLTIHLGTAIDNSVSGRADWATKEATHA
jgi:hypothetical protein